MPVQRGLSVQGIFYEVFLSIWYSWIIRSVLVPPLNGVRGTEEELAFHLATIPNVDPKCQGFTKVVFSGGGEFFSPNYPHQYFNDSKCNLTLIAPPEHTIEVDFREKFNIEYSPLCTKDYLEIFDGLGGHKTSLKRLCGTEFPDRIFSSGRYLYLAFKSDDTAQYEGFKGVFFFRPTEKSPQSCEHIETGSEGIIGTSDFGTNLANHFKEGNAIDCLWVINVTVGYKISLYFWEFELAFPNVCLKNFLRIYESRLDDETKKTELCGTQAKNGSYHNVPLYLYLYQIAKFGNFSHFKLHYSIYRRISGEDVCRDDEFDCKDQSCIDKSLKCNKRQNCKFLTDEDEALCRVKDEDSVLLKEKVMVVLIIGVLLLLSLVIAMVVSFKRQWGELNKRREEIMARYCLPIDHLDNGQRGDNDIDDGCYVPEVDLSIFHKRSNGGNAVVFEQEQPLNRIDHQFQQRGESQGSETSTPPPPPPPLYRNNVDGVLNNQSQTINNSTLDEEVEEAADVFPPTSSRQPVFDNRQFRSKAISQMEADRPQSFESTKSAPDVIGRH